MDTNKDSSTSTPWVRRYRTDEECRALATEFLATLVGSTPERIAWDRTNRLEGHLRLSGRELVVIAPRDEVHRPVVLTVDDWADVRCDGHSAGALLAKYSIMDHEQLVAALGN